MAVVTLRDFVSERAEQVILTTALRSTTACTMMCATRSAPAAMLLRELKEEEAESCVVKIGEKLSRAT